MIASNHSVKSIYGYVLPRTLADVARAEAKVLPERFREWLDYFYSLTDNSARSASMSEEPPLCKIWIWDVWFAASAEHLSRLARIPPPEWVFKEERYLRGSDVHWGGKTPQMKTLMFFQSPGAFRIRHVFVLASCLERASMPEKWRSDPWFGFERPGSESGDKEE